MEENSSIYDDGTEFEEVDKNCFVCVGASTKDAELKRKEIATEHFEKASK